MYEFNHIKAPTGLDNGKRKPWIVKAYPHTWLVFVCSVSDIFAPWTKPEWRDAVLDKIREPSPEAVIFQLLTKSPEGIPNDATYPENVWLGVTVTQQSEMPLLESLLDQEVIPSQGKFYLSCEPLLGFIDIPERLIEGLDWIIVGKLTGSRRVKLQREWVDDLFLQSDEYDIPLFIKDSVVEELGPKYAIKEFPEP